ncbi:hypothetical protein ABIC63_002924 [Pseudacidovorax sp. 1753]|uniref:hypothetical protein n=1 Tax=Pseudacidovorax sp. 1753 TaxID=3156419 RepID=UPI003395A9B7
MIRDVLRLKLHGGLSHEAIARSLSVSKGVVAKYVALASAAGLNRWESVEPLGQAELQRRLFGTSAEQRRVAQPDFARVHVELRRKGVTLTLLWEEYRAAHPGARTWGFTQFCEHYKRYARTLKLSMRQQHRAGEKLFVDYAGPPWHWPTAPAARCSWRPWVRPAIRSIPSRYAAAHQVFGTTPAPACRTTPSSTSPNCAARSAMRRERCSKIRSTNALMASASQDRAAM